MRAGKLNYFLKIILCIFFIQIQFIYCSNKNDKDFNSEIDNVLKEPDVNRRMILMTELLGKSDQYKRYIILRWAAKMAIATKNYSKAKEYSTELLSSANVYKDNWNFGNAIHDANMVLGMLALNENDIEAAKEYLIKAGKAPKSPQLQAFGPDMMLAEALIEKNENKIVIEYLQLCKNIWEKDNGQLDQWIQKIKNNEKPDFSFNLVGNHLGR